MTREDFLAKIDERFRFDDLTEIVPAAEWVYDSVIRPLHVVATAASALLDSSVALDWDDSRAPGYLHGGTDHDQLAAALDALEDAGWRAHDDD